MEVKTVLVSRDNPAEIFSIIENELVDNPNTQVFIGGEIFKKLRFGSGYHVRTSNYSKCFHYAHDEDNFGGEEWLELYGEKVLDSEGYYHQKTIARGSFISNCNKYMQLVEFHSSKIKRYCHYLTGFKKLLLIEFNEES